MLGAYTEAISRL